MAGAPLPSEDTKPEWQVFGLRQTGQLDQANGRTLDTIHIVEACEKREAEIWSAIRPRTTWESITPWREP